MFTVIIQQRVYRLQYCSFVKGKKGEVFRDSERKASRRVDIWISCPEQVAMASSMSTLGRAECFWLLAKHHYKCLVFHTPVPYRQLAPHCSNLQLSLRLLVSA
jgi:hypothetical protein